MLVGPRKCLKEIIQIELNGVKNPNWPEANQLAIYKCGEDLNLGLPTPRTYSASGQGGLELGTSELQDQRSNRSATLPSKYYLTLLSFSPLYPPLYLFTGVRPIQINHLSIRKYSCCCFLPLFCRTSLRVRDCHPFIRSRRCKLPKLC